MSFDLKKIKYIMFISSEHQALLRFSELPMSEALSFVRHFVSLFVCIKKNHFLIKDPCISNSMPASIVSLAY